MAFAKLLLLGTFALAITYASDVLSEPPQLAISHEYDVSYNSNS